MMSLNSSSTRDDGVSPSRSASTIVAASVYHVIKIEGYSNTLEAERSHQLSSCPFTSGGHTWHINYRPTGSRKSNTEYMSFFLVLEEEDTTTTVPPPSPAAASKSWHG